MKANILAVNHRSYNGPWSIKNTHNRSIKFDVKLYLISCNSITENGFAFITCKAILHDRKLHSLQWRHNGCDGGSNHQPHNCLLNRLFGRTSKKTSKLRALAFVREIHRWPVNFPHKWPITQKMFPFDYVITYSQYFSLSASVDKIIEVMWCQWVTAS